MDMIFRKLEYLGPCCPISTSSAVRSSRFSKLSSGKLLVLEDQDRDRNSAPWYAPSYDGGLESGDGKSDTEVSLRDR